MFRNDKLIRSFPVAFFGECCIMLYVKEYIFRGRRRVRGKERRITLLVTLCAAVILLVAADLISKAAAVSVLSQTGGALEFIPGLIRFEYHKTREWRGGFSAMQRGFLL